MRHTFRSKSNSVQPTTTHAARLFVIIVLGGLAAWGIAALGVRAYNKGVPKAVAGAPAFSPGREFPPLPPWRSGTQRKIEAEVITIRPTGFEPASITRPKGLFLLAIENRSGLRTIEVALDNEGGSRFYAERLRMDKHDLAQGLDLPPGRYVLREAGHPAWSCIITILDE